jgi:N-acetylmuramoyl-L-alanine amidase
LIGTLILSFTIPLLSVTVEKEVDFPAQINIENSNKVEISKKQIDSIDPEFSEASPSILDSVSLVDILTFVYISVFTFLLVRLIIGIVRILWKTRILTKSDSLNLILVKPDCKFKNSSFYRYIFIDESLTDEVKKQVIHHEEVHVSEFHFIDKLIVGISICILWFNPFMYAYLYAVDANHEFEVDAKSIKAFDKKSYASLILSLAQPSYHLFINHFSRLPLKKRMNMLFQNPTKRMKKLVYLSIVPLMAMCCLAFVKQNEVLVFKTEPNLGIINKEKLNKPLKTDTLIGRTMIGNITELISEISLYNAKVDVNGKKLAIQLSPVDAKKVKVGDYIIFKVKGYIDNVKIYDKSSKLISKGDAKTYIAINVIDNKGSNVFPKPVIAYAFLNEKNGVQYTNSKIEKIVKNDNNEIQRIVLNDGTFKIEINLGDLELKNENFKIGDNVTARFIEEKLAANRYFKTNKMVSIYNITQKVSLINQVLHPKFYTEDGKQIQKSSKIDSKPQSKDYKDFDFKKYIQAYQPSNINTRNFTSKLPSTKIEQTLVIDAGHGGEDGATKSYFTGEAEKDLNLRAALILKEEAEKRGIKVVMTREKDKFLTLKQRVEFQKGANAFVSIHHNSMPMNKKTKLPISNEGFRGVEIYISNNAVSQGQSSKMFGENVLTSLKNLKGFPVRDSLIDKNLYVIREAIVPSILVEFANLSYKEGNDFVSDEANVRRICNLILDGFEKDRC